MIIFFFSKLFGAIIFPFLYRAELFFTQRGWGIFVWRNVAVLEGELGAARYCAEGKICNDHRSLQIQLGVWGAL